MENCGSSDDWNLDEMDWDQEMRQIYYDDSWATKEDKFDDAKDWELQKAILKSAYMSFPSTLLDMFQQSDPDLNERMSFTQSNPYERHGRKSTLTLKEMERFLKLEKPFKKKQSISDCRPNQYNDYKEYKALQSKVLQEQEEYQNFLYQVASNQISEYNHLDPNASKWVKKWLDASAARIQEYEQYYIHLKGFGISFIPFKNDILPSAIQNLTVTLGVQKQLASLKFPLNIPKAINQKPRRKIPEKSICWEKCVVSKDVNAFKLAIAWNADVVISLGTLQTLADNHSPFQTEWEIPIVVRAYEGIEFDKKRKIAFIDKPLPPKKITPRETNWRYFKEVVKFLTDVPYVWGISSPKEDPNYHQPSSTSGLDENCSSLDDDTIMQLDGANDEKTSETGAKQMKMKDKRLLEGDKEKPQSKNESKTHSFMGFKNIWTQERDDDSSSSSMLSIDESNPEGFQPFIGRKSVSVLLSKVKAPQSKPKESKEEPIKKSPERKFEGLFFGVLPDSAISSSQGHDTGLQEVVQPEKEAMESEIKTEPARDVAFTPRRSLRKKPDHQKPVSKNTSSDQSSSAASLFAKARSKAKGKKKTISTPTRSSTSKKIDDRSVDAENADLLGKILPLDIDKKSQIKEEVQVSDKPKDESSDLLGQILGKPSSANTRGDVTASWAEDAKSMDQSDPDRKYSTTNLGLLEPRHGKNLSYTMWKFGKKRVLIRYTTHGDMHVPVLSKLDKEFQDPQVPQSSMVSLKTKLEYQSNFVYEQMTMSEICRDWVTMMIKRPSKIVRARIDPHQRKILDVEWTMTLNHLNDKAEKVGFNSAICSKLLTKILEMISNLDKGTFICCHRESENKVVVRQATDNTSKKVVYDLQKEYCNPGQQVFHNTSVPWIRGDPQKGLQLHSKHSLVPMTFDPRNDPDPGKVGKSAPSVKKGRKRKK